jgi:anti-anti-sigma factor
MSLRPPEALAVQTIAHATGVRAQVRGDLDPVSSPTLVDQVSAVFGTEAGAAADGELTLDLAGVDFCDSAGASALVTLRQRSVREGWRFQIVNLQPPVRRMLVDFTGLGDYLNVR